MTMNQNDHDQIIDQVISLENEFSDPSGAMVANAEHNELSLTTSDPIMTTAITPQHIDMSDMNQAMQGISQLGHQQQHHQQHHQHLQHHQQQQPCVMPMDNDSCERQQEQQLSTSSEDLLNLLLEFDRDSSNMIGGVHSLDQDEKIGIETIRKQLMSCEVQSEQLQQHPHQQHSNSMSPIVSPMTCQQPQQQQPQPQITPTQQHHQNLHQLQQQQLISQTAPVIPQHQQQHPSLTNSSLSQQQQRQQLPQHHQRLSVDQSLLNGPYSSSTVNFVPVSTSSRSYVPSQQQHQNISRVNQTNPIAIVSNSPSPSWQQNQQSISPFSPQQNQHHLQQQPLTPQQQRQHHPNATATSPQLQQQLQQHHPLRQQSSPSQSVSPPVTTTTVAVNAATTEPSPVVKKNPLLNAQLVNSRAPSITPTRFLSNQTNLLNQNPILNSKLSQSPFAATNSCSPVNPNLNPQSNSRFVQQQQPQQVLSNFNYDINPQQHQHNPAQTGGHISLYGQTSDQQLQNTNQQYRASTTTTTGISTGATSPPVSFQTMMTIGGSNLSQQVKQEIRRKVSQPKQSQHQTTSLLKQLLSDDNK